MEELNDSQIQNILKAYKRKRESEIKHYHTVLKNNPEFQKKNRERSKIWYQKNKDKRKNYYQDNKDLHNSKTLYKYHLKKDNLDYFKTKHEEKYQLLIESGFIKVEDQN
jgi:hypothetical protein